MAISRVGATNNGTLPSGLASGDLIVILALNNASTTIPSTPTGYTLFTSATNASAGNESMSLFWKIAGSSETYPTITGATSSVCVAYSGTATTSPFVEIAGQDSSGSSSSISYSGIVSYQNPGKDWVLTFAAANSNSGALGSHPANSMVLPTNGEYTDSTDDVAIFDSNGPLSTYSFNTKTLPAAVEWMTKTAELVAASGGTQYTQSLTAAVTFTGSDTKATSKGLSGVLSFVGSIAEIVVQVLSLTASLAFSGTAGKQPKKTLAANLIPSASTTNLVTYSQSFGNWAINGSPVTVTDNTYVAPDGTTTAASLSVSSADSGVSNVPGGVPAGEVFTYSIFAKSISGTTSNILIGTHSATGGYITVNLSNGAEVAMGGAGAQGYEIVSYGNGWYRVSITIVTLLSDPAFIVYVPINSSAVYAIWGAQVEFGSSATGYVPTSGTSENGDSQLFKFVYKNTSALLTFTGSVTKQLQRSLSAVLGFSGSVAKRVAHLATAALSFTGSISTILVQQYTILLTAALSFTGGIAKRPNKALTAVLGFTGVIGRAIGKVMDAVLALAGKIGISTNIKYPPLITQTTITMAIPAPIELSLSASQPLTLNMVVPGAINISMIVPGPIVLEGIKG